MAADEIRPDDRRSGEGHADGGTEPRLCCGNSGAERRTAPDGGDEGREPRSGGSEPDECVPGDGRSGGEGLRRDDESFELPRGGSSEPLPEPPRRDDESSLTRELRPGSNVTTSS
jgi:hypothetical protein